MRCRRSGTNVADALTDHGAHRGLIEALRLAGGSPYDGETPDTRNVPGYGSHATSDTDTRGGLLRALCSFSWAKEEGHIVSGLPDCRECRREVQLGAERPCGSS
ncbi:hypothetical protein OG625_40260 (plasmid) [Streptomyces sp. NBC_01351]|uniref:hypothetical protein n=1 Tax=Streptomyces sp. NBC_01351 TaxID=2903833 RepID=UPI002E361AAC|nr:hypothetical protein [Streptomyces sp. NBC_01351]